MNNPNPYIPTPSPERTPDLSPIGVNESNEDPHRLAHGFLAIDPESLRHHNGRFCKYSGGGYQAMPDSEIEGPLRCWIRADFERINRLEIVRWSEKATGRKPQIPKVTNAIVANAMGALRSITRIPSVAEPPTWIDGVVGPNALNLLPLQNGILNLAIGNLLPSTPSLFTFNALPYQFSPNASVPTLWLKFLSQLWPDDPESIASLQELFGYCLTPDTRQQKIFLLIGPKRSGKGTLLRVLRALIGPGNVVGPTLTALSHPFGLEPLLGKSLALVSEARLSGRADAAAIAELLLSISGEDVQTVCRKHLSAVTLKLPTRFILATNEMPRLNDSSGALAGRFIIHSLTRSFFGKEDNSLTDRLLAELPGILLWAIRGWKRLNNRGHFLQPKSGVELVAELEDLASPVGAFIREKCVSGPGERVLLTELYKVWREWCTEQGRREPGTEQTFGRDLRAAVPGLRNWRPQIDGERPRGYQGIRVRTFRDHNHDPSAPSAPFSFAREDQTREQEEDAMGSNADAADAEWFPAH